MARRPAEPIEIACPTCGLIAELYGVRGSRRPKLCGCPEPERVRSVTTPRRCISCPTILNRYNPGPECSACQRARERDRARA